MGGQGVVLIRRRDLSDRSHAPPHRMRARMHTHAQTPQVKLSNDKLTKEYVCVDGYEV